MRATGSCMIIQVHRFLCVARKTCIHTLARRRQVSHLNSLSAAVRAAEDMAGAILHACRSLLANEAWCMAPAAASLQRRSSVAAFQLDMAWLSMAAWRCLHGTQQLGSPLC